MGTGLCPGSNTGGRAQFTQFLLPSSPSLSWQLKPPNLYLGRTSDVESLPAEPANTSQQMFTLCSRKQSGGSGGRSGAARKCDICVNLCQSPASHPAVPDPAASQSPALVLAHQLPLLRSPECENPPSSTPEQHCCASHTILQLKKNTTRGKCSGEFPEVRNSRVFVFSPRDFRWWFK